MNHGFEPLKGLAVVALAFGMAVPALAQRAGQSVSIQYGVVNSARQVDLRSGAVPAGVLVGGTLGLVSASGKSSSKKARNAIIGAAAGGAIAGAAQGSTYGMLYDVSLVGQGAMQVVSDQREAEECLVAKQQLVDATTESAMDMAARKVQLLCND